MTNDKIAKLLKSGNYEDFLIGLEFVKNWRYARLKRLINFISEFDFDYISIDLQRTGTPILKEAKHYYIHIYNDGVLIYPGKPVADKSIYHYEQI